MQEYDALTTRNNQNLTILVNSNIVVSSMVKTVSNLLNDKNKSQISLEPVEETSSFFKINPSTRTNQRFNDDYPKI